MTRLNLSFPCHHWMTSLWQLFDKFRVIIGGNFHAQELTSSNLSFDNLKSDNLKLVKWRVCNYSYKLVIWQVLPCQIIMFFVFLIIILFLLKIHKNITLFIKIINFNLNNNATNLISWKHKNIRLLILIFLIRYLNFRTPLKCVHLWILQRSETFHSHWEIIFLTISLTLPESILSRIVTLSEVWPDKWPMFTMMPNEFYKLLGQMTS